tara:strand:- start:388 stop:702 length:315 start_codon:yes stop_codon:yes gene_type:complete
MTHDDYNNEIKRLTQYFSDEGAWIVNHGKSMNIHTAVTFDLMNHQYVTYAHNAKKVLTHSKNSDAYEENNGHLPRVDTYNKLVKILAFETMLADMIDNGFGLQS